MYELETAYDHNSAESTPDAQVNIMTAIEVDFNAALGATYEIQFSTDTFEWTVIEAAIVGEGNAVERLYSRKDFPTGFFRVERAHLSFPLYHPPSHNVPRLREPSPPRPCLFSEELLKKTAL